MKVFGCIVLILAIATGILTLPSSSNDENNPTTTPKSAETTTITPATEIEDKLTTEEKSVIVEQKDLIDSEDELKKYDTYNLTDCLAILPLVDSQQNSSYDIIGKSDCLEKALEKVREAKKSAMKIEDSEN